MSSLLCDSRSSSSSLKRIDLVCERLALDTERLRCRRCPDRTGAERLRRRVGLGRRAGLRRAGLRRAGLGRRTGLRRRAGGLRRRAAAADVARRNVYLVALPFRLLPKIDSIGHLRQ